MLLNQNPYDLAILFSLFILSIGLHEAAHAYTANALGDDTPRREGRLTINPIAHLDLFGTIFLLLAGFGWGKSVNVDPRNLRRPNRDMALIAFAGPGANLVLGVLSLLIWALVRGGSMSFLTDTLEMSAMLNFFLMFLNLVPIPPLDGSKVIRPLLPEGIGRKFDELAPYGSLIFLGLIFLPVISTFFLGTLHGLTSSTIRLVKSQVVSQESIYRDELERLGLDPETIQQLEGQQGNESFIPAEDYKDQKAQEDQEVEQQEDQQDGAGASESGAEESAPTGDKLPAGQAQDTETGSETGSDTGSDRSEVDAQTDAQTIKGEELVPAQPETAPKETGL